MNLTIKLPEEDVQALKAKATARGVSAEQYALQVLEKDLAPEWLRESWASAKESGLAIDTNIVISALLQPLGPPAQVFLLALSGPTQLCVSGEDVARRILRSPTLTNETNHAAMR
jgi:plasmid stability protein